MEKTLAILLILTVLFVTFVYNKDRREKIILNKKIDSIEHKIDNLESKIDNTESEIATVNTKIDSITNKVANLEDFMNSKKSTSHVCKTIYNSNQLRDDINSLNNYIDDFNSDMNNIYQGL